MDVGELAELDPGGPDGPLHRSAQERERRPVVVELLQRGWVVAEGLEGRAASERLVAALVVVLMDPIGKEFDEDVEREQGAVAPVVALLGLGRDRGVALVPRQGDQEFVVEGLEEPLDFALEPRAASRDGIAGCAEDDKRVREVVVDELRPEVISTAGPDAAHMRPVFRRLPDHGVHDGLARLLARRSAGEHGHAGGKPRRVIEPSEKPGPHHTPGSLECHVDVERVELEAFASTGGLVADVELLLAHRLLTPEETGLHARLEPVECPAERRERDRLLALPGVAPGSHDIVREADVREVRVAQDGPRGHHLLDAELPVDALAGDSQRAGDLEGQGVGDASSALASREEAGFGASPHKVADSLTHQEFSIEVRSNSDAINRIDRG